MMTSNRDVCRSDFKITTTTSVSCTTEKSKKFFFFKRTRQIFAAYHLGYMQPINQHDYYNVTYD